MPDPILSILIPSIPSRAARLEVLLTKLHDQQRDHALDVEILALVDNKRRPVGGKRQALLEIARGRYVAFCDDDDDIADDYLPSLCSVAETYGKDVVTFLQRVLVDGQEGTAHFSIQHPADEPFTPGATFRRRPWHVCAWRRDLALRGVFTEKSYGEDADWVAQVAPFARSGSHIARILHTYRYDSQVSEAPAPV